MSSGRKIYMGSLGLFSSSLPPFIAWRSIVCRRLSGKVVVQELSVLRPEYLLLFKAKAFLDLSARKANGEHVDSRDIKKHKNDILRIAME